MKRLRRLLSDDCGAALVEATLIFPMLLILTFGLVEFGNALWQWNSAEKATAMAARYLATRGPLLAGVPDCFVSTSMTAGTSCSQVPGSTGWTATCTVSGGPCNGAVLNAAVDLMQTVAPFVEDENVEVELNGSALGFVGRGDPVPFITVRLEGAQFELIAIDDLLNLDAIQMPTFDATSVGEDQNEGTGTS